MNGNGSSNGFADKGLDEGSFEPSNGFSVKSFDAFPKTKHTYLTATHNGTLWTIALAAFCSWLTVTEFWRWMEGTTLHNYSVEKGVAHDLQINMDIVVAMNCKDLHVNIQDASGDRVLASEKLRKDPTNFEQWGHGKNAVDKKTGERRHADTYGGPAWVKQTALQYADRDDVHKYLGEARARRKWPTTPRLRGRPEDACRLFGSVEGNKVQGDFHITARGHGYQQSPGAGHLEHQIFNFSHHINELSFGPYFPAIVQPLDATHMTTPYHFYKYQYFLSIVPTIYTDSPHKLTTSSPPHIAQQNYAELQRRRGERKKKNQHGTWNAGAGNARGQAVVDMAASEPDHPSHLYGGSGSYNPFASSTHTIYTNQYAVTEQSRPVGELSVPGIFMKYDIEPVLLTVSETWGGFIGLFVRCVNVVAGVMVAGGWIISLQDWVGEVSRRRRARTGSLGGLLHGGGNKEKKGME